MLLTVCDDRGRPGHQVVHRKRDGRVVPAAAVASYEHAYELVRAHRCRATAFTAPSRRRHGRTDLPNIRDPRREEYTICTALASDAVFTAGRHGDTSQLYGPV